MKREKRFSCPGWMVMLVWILLLLIVWEIGATVVAQTKRCLLYTSILNMEWQQPHRTAPLCYDGPDLIGAAVSFFRRRLHYELY